MCDKRTQKDVCGEANVNHIDLKSESHVPRQKCPLQNCIHDSSRNFLDPIYGSQRSILYSKWSKALEHPADLHFATATDICWLENSLIRRIQSCYIALW